MARMADEFIDLTVTSPPYDGLREYKGYVFEFDKIAKELFRVTKKGGTVVWVLSDETKNGCESLTSFKQAIYFVEQCGFNLHDTMIWNKPAVGACGSRLSYWQAFEYMFIFSKGAPMHINRIADKINVSSGKKRVYAPNGFRGDKKGLIVKEKTVRTNVWDIFVGIADNSDRVGHPAPFPEKLARDHIYSWSNEGDLVYDPFMGSGTTAKAAHLLKRQWIGSEISQEYVDLANKRLEKYLKQEVLDL